DRTSGLVRPARADRKGAGGGSSNRAALCAGAGAAAFGRAAWDPALRRAFPRRKIARTPVTSLPDHVGTKRLGLVIDLDICVGCHACAVNCKEWNSGGIAAPLTDLDPYGAEPSGVWFNRVHSFEVGEGAAGRTVHFPR